MWDLPVEKHLIPVSQWSRRLPKKYEGELRQKLRSPPEPILDSLSAFLYHGMARQLTSMPIDIRVEGEIAKDLFEHKPAQHAYLARQVKDLEAHFMPEVAEATPDHIYAACTAMNIVLVEEAAEIAGV